MKLNIDNLVAIFKTSFESQMDPNEVESLIPNLIGDPGLGKTSIGKQAAMLCANNVVFSSLLATSSGTEDFGVAVPDLTNGTLKLLTRGKLVGDIEGVTDDTDLIVLFIDEVDKYPTDIQGALLTLIQDRHFDGIPVDPRLVFVAAMNPSGCGGSELIQPLHERMTEYHCDADAEAWIDYAIANGIDPSIIAFIYWQCVSNHRSASTSRGSDLPVGSNVFSYFNEDDEVGARPSPRAWAKASVILNSSYMSDQLIKEGIEGTVGKAFAAQFLAFKRIYTSDPPPSLDEIIENPSTAVVPNDPATVFAVVAMIVQYVASKGDRARDENAIKTFVVDAIVEYIERLHNEAHQIYAVKQCGRLNRLFLENKSDIINRYR